MREYESNPNPESETRETQFKLDGEVFTVTLRSDGDAVLEWSEMAYGATINDANMSSAAGTAFIARFFKLMLAYPEYLRFRQHMQMEKTHPDILGEIMQGINMDMEELLEDVTDGRPPVQPSPSSPGPTARVQHTSRTGSTRARTSRRASERAQAKTRPPGAQSRLTEVASLPEDEGDVVLALAPQPGSVEFPDPELTFAESEEMDGSAAIAAAQAKRKRPASRARRAS